MFYCVTVQGQTDGSCDEYTEHWYLSKEDALKEHTPGHTEFDGELDDGGHYWYWYKTSEPIPSEYVTKPYHEIFYGPGVEHTCAYPPNWFSRHRFW